MDLHLNLFRKWYDMIQQKVKLEEYREINAYWCNRLLLFKGRQMPKTWWDLHFEKIKKMKTREKKYYFDAGIKYWDIFYQERGEEKCEWYEAYDGFVYALNKPMAMKKAKVEARQMLIHDMGVNVDETIMEIEIAQLYETIEEACL